MNERSPRGPLLACAAGLLLGGVFQTGLPAGAQSNPERTPKLAPVLTRPDLTGHPVPVGALRGHVVLLNFWATWCGPCLAEMPVFTGWQKEYESRGLNVIGVSMDDDEAPVKKVVARLHLDYPVAMGDAKLGSAYGGVLGLPVTFLIARDGAILRRYEGAANLTSMQHDVEAALSAR